MASGLRAAETPAAARPLIVGLSWATEGDLSAEEAARIPRFETELALAIARVQHTEVRFRLAPLDQLFRELEAGKVDFIPGIARTRERLMRFDFSVPHSRLTTNIFVRSGDSRAFEPNHLQGLRIIVVKDGYSHLWAIEQGYGAQLVPVPDILEGVRRLSNGDADCMLAKQLNIYTAMRTARVANIEVRGPPVPDLIQDLCVAVRLGNRDLLARINESLFTLKQTGELDRIYEQWLSLIPAEGNWAATHVRLIAAIFACLLALVAGIWILSRLQARQNWVRMAEVERRVTERTEELAATKARFELLLANTPAGIVLIDPHDPVTLGAIVECNEMTGLLHGYTRTELLGASFNILRQEPFTREQFAAIAAEVKDGNRRRGHARHRRKDGAICEIEFHTTGVTLGGRDLLLAVDLDITDRLRAEAALRRTEEFQRLVLQATSDGIFDWEIVDDRFTLSDRGWQMLGFSPGELNGRLEWWRRLHPDDLAGADTTLRRHLDGGAPFVHTARHLHKDGSVRWLYCRAHTLRDAAGRPTRMIGSYTDITDLKRIDEELQLSRRLRAVGELTGGIAHEFNNLLTPILLEASMLAEARDLPPDLAAQLGPVREAARRAQALTQRLLQFGRKGGSGVEAVSLAAVIESTLSLVRSTVDRRIDLQAECAADLPSLRLDGATMGQVVMNLVLNARDAVLDKLGDQPAPDWRPQIVLRVERRVGPSRAPGRPADGASRAWQRLSVHDNGPGIPAEIRERVFEPFFTTKSVGQGTGLGLSMVWSAVEEWHGWIDVISEPGDGTEFALWLPDDAVVPVAPAISAAPAAPRAPANRRLLLVDDDALVGATVARLLQHLGYTVEWKRSSEEALTALHDHGAHWDALITDLNMAGLSGEDLVERVRRSGYKGKIVVVSGHITAQAEARLRLAGVAALVQKPFEAQRLKSILAELWPAT